jgi:predicted Fe-Mo cluster-binding NifX family protein
MIYAIPSKENHIDSNLDDHFSRSAHFCIYNSCSQEAIFINNPHKDCFENTAEQVESMLSEFNIETTISRIYGQKLHTILKNKSINLIIIEDNKINTIKQIINLIDKND